VIAQIYSGAHSEEQLADTLPKPFLEEDVDAALEF
jgi:hypothetical protein